MNVWKTVALAAVAGVCLTVAAPRSEAQISIGVNVGAEPGCPYGYFDYAPYACSPYGYYGPQYFNGGVFVGVGPWFHGGNEFHGTVNNRFDPQHGYRGRMPQPGEHARAQVTASSFKGNEERDGRGHATGGKR